MLNDLDGQKVFGSKVIEKDQRLSRSILWRLHAAFYQQSGITAWNRGMVPYYITNNPHLAAAYTGVVHGYLRDHPPLDPQQPVYLLELGAGSGRFAYHFLQRFFLSLEHSPLRGMRFVYLMSDLAESNVNYWSQHPRLRPYLESGQLDLACFNPLQDHELHLVGSGVTLRAGSLANPLIVLANYFFDSLPNDLFSIHNGILCEELVTLSGNDPHLDPNDPAIVPALEIRFHPRFHAPNYYTDPDFDQILQSYLPVLDGAYFQIPLGGLNSLRCLQKLSNNRLLLLSADKGSYRLEDLRSPAQPQISLHGSGISMRVNFHALGRYIHQQGGLALHSQHREEGLVISALLLDHRLGEAQETRRAFQEAIEQNSPDDFFMLKKAFQPHYAAATFEQLLAFLRLSGYDPQIFSGMLPMLEAFAQTINLRQQEYLYEAAWRVWSLFYPIGEPFDLQLALGKLFVTLLRYPEALECLHSSHAFYGPSPEKDELIALCRRYVWEDPGTVSIEGGLN